MKLPVHLASSTQSKLFLKPQSLLLLRNFSAEPTPPPPQTPSPQREPESSIVTQAVDLLRQTPQDEWTSSSQLKQLLFSSSSSHSPRDFFQITRRFSSSAEALSFFNYVKSNSENENSLSLSYTFQAIFEIAKREPNSQDKLFDLYKTCKENNITLSVNAATLLLRFFGKADMVDKSLVVYNELDEDARNTHIRNVLIDVLLKDGRVDDAFNVLDEMLDRESEFPPNDVTGDIIFYWLTKKRRPGRYVSDEEIVGLVTKFGEHGVFPNTVWLTQLITRFYRIAKGCQAWDLFHELMKLGADLEAVSCNALLSGLGRDGDFKRMNQLLMEMKENNIQPDVVTFGILINRLHGRIHSAVELFREMMNKGLKGNAITYTILINAFCNVNNIQEAVDWFNAMCQSGCSADAIVYYALIAGLCQAGRMKDASFVASKLKEAGFYPDIVCYNVMIGGFCKRNKLDEAYGVLKEMEGAGMKPDCVTYNTLISYFCKSGKFSVAHTIMNRMTKDGVKPTVVTYGALINGYCLVGDIDEAMKIFKEMSSSSKVSPNTVIYNILIDSLCKIGKVESALSLMDDMRNNGAKPNTATYNAMFKGLREKNMLEKTFNLMDKMVEHACPPDYISMEILLEWLSAVGETEKLKKFTQGFRVSPSPA
ncbi:hypothetical protein Dsin_026024 [Dipteronia sinensis]|uniref:Pentatricopeptide repeat-containing protein n=1 Tax=Dipteronia sinensis TaxID=43782 RepID=A0AAD9ZY06_9ROSI|nr:hypothetical protein Dsin_026024 [Dipteronia sinensis]